MNLLLRLLTATIIILAFVSLLLFASNQLFIWVSLLIITIIAFEWAVVSGVRCFIWRLAYALLLAITLYIFLFSSVRWLIEPVITLVSLFWIASIFIAIPAWRKFYQNIFVKCGASLILGFFVLTGFALALLSIHSFSIWMLVLIIFSCVIFDSFSYFCGKWKGRNKLCPSISPGKTWEGLIGGTLATAIANASFIALLTKLNQLPEGSFLLWFSLSLLAALFALIGDLLESLLKRINGLKDSSGILPGHGGLLDRFDSYFAALPITASASGLFGLDVYSL